MFNKFGLQKIVITTSLMAGIAVVAVLVVLGVSDYNAASQKMADALALDMRKKVDAKIENKLDIGITGAVSFASNTELLKAVYSGDKVHTQQILSGIGETFRNNTKFKNIKIHIHTPENHSFLRSWKKKNGDDLSSFRYGVQKVIDEKTPMRVLELGRAGLAVRGIVPLLLEGEYIGSLEFIQGVASVHKSFLNTEGAYYLMLLDKSVLEISTKVKDYPTAGEYYFASKSWFSKEAVAFTQKIDFESLKAQGWLLQDGYFITYENIKDLHDKEVGIHLLASPDTEFLAKQNELFSDKMSQVLLTITVVLLLVFVLVIVIRRKVIKPIDDLNQIVEKIYATGDLSIQTDTGSNSNTEVDRMAKHFGSLLSTIRMAIDEANAVIGDIADGQFGNRIKVELKGDLNTLKEGVNKSANSIDLTLKELGAILQGLTDGDFSVRANVNAEGDFKRMVENSTLAMETLETTFESINEVMSDMEAGRYHHRINVDASGSLLKLKNIVNRSMDALEGAISDITGVVVAQSEGDLTKSITRDYHGELRVLKEAINASAVKLNTTVTEILRVSDSVAHASNQVAAGSKELSQRTQEQAAVLEETSASMEEMTATVGQNTDAAQQANQLSTHARNAADGGADIARKAVDSMAHITESSNKIAEIITMIDGIAFQTNLLALNAAVEAARAGDNGRGFAVVAGEVRTLAQRSADASNEIKSLIENSVTTVGEGSKFVTETGTSLTDINQSIQKVNDIVAEIASASSEQATGINQVNTSIASMDHVTQQNAALVEETTSAAEALSGQASHLKKLVGFFKTDTAAS